MGKKSEENDSQNKDDDNNSESMFTQEDLNRIGKSEKADGRRTALEEVAEKLGVEDLDEAAAILQAHRESEEKDKSETEKLKDEATKASEDARREKAEAQAERQAFQVERALLKAGVLAGDDDDDSVPDHLERAVRLIELPSDADADAISEAVKSLKKDVPSFFGKSGSKDKGGPPDTDAGSDKNKKSDPGTARQSASDRLRRNHPKLAKKD